MVIFFIFICYFIIFIFIYSSLFIISSKILCDHQIFLSLSFLFSTFPLSSQKSLDEAKEEGNAEEMEKMAKRTVRITKEMTEDCKKMLRLMGIPVIEAPCEGWGERERERERETERERERE